MTRTETEQVLRRVYDAYDRADVDEIAELTGEHPVMHVPGSYSLIAVYDGLDATWTYLGKVAEVLAEASAASRSSTSPLTRMDTPPRS